VDFVNTPAEQRLRLMSIQSLGAMETDGKTSGVDSEMSRPRIGLDPTMAMKAAANGQ
jgi:hypothetical protein